MFKRLLTFCSLLIIPLSAHSANVSTATVNGTQAWDIVYQQHTYNVVGNNSTVWVDIWDNGVKVSTGVYWIYNSTNFNLPGGTNSAAVFGPLSGFNYGIQNVNVTGTRQFKNRDTGVLLGQYTDQTIWTYAPGPMPSGADTSQETITTVVNVNANGDPCPNPRTGLDFYLQLTINPALQGGNVDGTYSIVLQIDGATARTQSLPLYGMAPGSQTIEIGETGLSTSHRVFNYAWKVNGTTVASGSYGCVDEIPLNEVNSSGQYSISTEPGETPTQTQTQSPPSTDSSGNTTNTSTTSSGTTSGGNYTPGYTTQTQTSTVNRGGIAGDSITNQDIYNDVYRALIDAGATGTFPNTEFEPIDVSDDGGLSELAGVQTEITTKSNAAQDTIIGKLSTVNTSGLPTSSGTVTSYNLGSLHPSLPDIILDFSWFNNGIALLRLAILFIMTIAFYHNCLRTLGEYIV